MSFRMHSPQPPQTNLDKAITLHGKVAEAQQQLQSLILQLSPEDQKRYQETVNPPVKSHGCMW